MIIKYTYQTFYFSAVFAALSAALIALVPSGLLVHEAQATSSPNTNTHLSSSSYSSRDDPMKVHDASPIRHQTARQSV